MGARIAAACFKSIMINHKTTYDSVMKRHLLPWWTTFQRAGGYTPGISPLSSVPDLEITSRCYV